ncbi:MAG: T9SS type A sorting domain-containing protein, partial [Bacteroidales bacterium]|nr:T9SS type A sorting domain-containing protein [Bacteroidales bacterium]
ENEDMHLFPNPWSAGALKISFSNQEIDQQLGSVKITTMNGKLLYQGEMTDDGRLQPQPLLEKGIFIVTIMKGVKHFHFKLVKI